MTAGAPPRFYFSLRSPYSWLAHWDLTQRYPQVAASLEWRPFWEPDGESVRMLAEAGAGFPYVDHSRAKARYVLADVRRLAARRGLTVTWPVDRQPCWEVPHLAYLLAERYGRGRAFVAAVYRARWEEGADICDRATVARLADELGLPAGELAGAVDDPAARRLGLEALLAVDADGVFGVPFFIHRYDKYWGVDRLPWFVETLQAAPGGIESGHEDRRPHEVSVEKGPVPALPAGDQGHAGGCG
ncbi:DsbA family protein [Actinocrinis puniceicyclus]|uniref:2-hydroxychromene-2-carboxylate isomerase n=1 Tax=Actinocrinis puniceicyclus TaxID=977794 RepID=A0A8J7WJA1_9ACTN|nr:DsbA family protein [Actinocrinis puniceicyclus]MBS2962343.1 DsbA family protein [Actinocrinis puniceicyclus]